MTLQQSRNDPNRKREDFDELAGEPSREDERDGKDKKDQRRDDVEELSGEPVRDDDKEENESS